MPPVRTCPNGHRFNKTSDCPTCPQCEVDRAPKKGWMSAFSAPARRALEEAGITSVKQLAKRTRQEVMALHGIGPASLPRLQEALEAAGLAFKEHKERKAAPSADPTVAYFAALPADKRAALQALRSCILRAVPGIAEHFGYGMPAFKFNGHPMLYIGAAKHHCALYGGVPVGFRERLKDFDVDKGTIRFTPEKPLPAQLVQEIVYAKVAEIEERWPAGPTKSRRRK